MEMKLIIDFYHLNSSIRWFWEYVAMVFDAPFYIVLIGLVYWIKGRVMGFRTATFIVFNNILNQGLKGLLRGSRPFHDAPNQLLNRESGYGLPSGHAQNASFAWGALSRFLSKTYKIIFLMLVVLVSISRVALGVHYIHQVVIGLVIGLGLSVYFMKLTDDHIQRLIIKPSSLYFIVISIILIESVQRYFALALPAGVLSALLQCLVLLSGYLGIFIGHRLNIVEGPRNIDFTGVIKRVFVGLVLTLFPILGYALLKNNSFLVAVHYEMKSIAFMGSGFMMSYVSFLAFKYLKI